MLALAYLAKSLDRYLRTLQQKSRSKNNHAGAGEDETRMHGQEHDWREMPVRTAILTLGLMWREV